MAVILQLGSECHGSLRALADAPSPWRDAPDGGCRQKAVSVGGREFLVRRDIRGEPVPVLRVDARGDAGWTLWIPADAPRGRPVEAELSGEPAALYADLAILSSVAVAQAAA